MIGGFSTTLIHTHPTTYANEFSCVEERCQLKDIRHYMVCKSLLPVCSTVPFASLCVTGVSLSTKEDDGKTKGLAGDKSNL